ncbi:MAG: RNA pseudouridine synthase [Saprospiraceae bacterium]|nr:RNA pseudouridine synthase [Saprospiraceae bacterium]
MKPIFDILYEDNHLLVVIKPTNILSQSDITGEDSMVELVNDYLRIKYNKPGKAYVGLLHRLDRPVSGIMVFAKNSKSFERMQKQIKYRTVDKYYLAISAKKAEKLEQEITHFLVKDSKLNMVKVSSEPVEGSKDCILRYKLIGEKNGKFLYLIKLITGRPHQIRAQMAFIGCPLMGDIKYGRYLPKESHNLALFSFKMAIDHPVIKERMIWEAYPESKGYWKGMEVFFPIK